MRMRVKFVEEGFVADVENVTLKDDRAKGAFGGVGVVEKSIEFSFTIFEPSNAPSFVRNMTGVHTVLLKTVDMTQKYTLKNCYITGLNVKYLGVSLGVQYNLEMKIGEMEVHVT